MKCPYLGLGGRMSLWILMIGLLMLVTASGQNNDKPEGGASKVVHARQIVIEDEKGVARMYIGAPVPDPLIGGKSYKRRNPETGIIFNDSKGDEVGGLGLLDDGTMDICFDHKWPNFTQERMCFVKWPDATTGLDMFSNKSATRIHIGINKNGDAEILLNDESGATRTRLSVASDGSPHFEVVPQNGRPEK